MGGGRGDGRGRRRGKRRLGLGGRGHFSGKGGEGEISGEIGGQVGGRGAGGARHGRLRRRGRRGGLRDVHLRRKPTGRRHVQRGKQGGPPHRRRPALERLGGRQRHGAASDGPHDLGGEERGGPVPARGLGVRGPRVRGKPLRPPGHHSASVRALRCLWQL